MSTLHFMKLCHIRLALSKNMKAYSGGHSMRYRFATDFSVMGVFSGESNMQPFNLNDVGKFFRPAFLILSRLFRFCVAWFGVLNANG